MYLDLGASPMAVFKSGVNPEDLYSRVYLTIPENCTYLKQAIMEIANQYGITRPNIYESSAKDRIVLAKNYVGVPAWALSWVKDAEDYYLTGNGPRAIGLHIEQGKTGRDWELLPNLYPKNLWDEADAKIRSAEIKWFDDIEKLLKEAERLTS